MEHFEFNFCVVQHCNLFVGCRQKKSQNVLLNVRCCESESFIESMEPMAEPRYSSIFQHVHRDVSFM